MPGRPRSWGPEANFWPQGPPGVHPTPFQLRGPGVCPSGYSACAGGAEVSPACSGPSAPVLAVSDEFPFPLIKVSSCPLWGCMRSVLCVYVRKDVCFYFLEPCGWCLGLEQSARQFCHRSLPRAPTQSPSLQPGTIVLKVVSAWTEMQCFRILLPFYLTGNPRNHGPTLWIKKQVPQPKITCSKIPFCEQEEDFCLCWNS